uniref:Cilia and flagella associated protein 57 n=1 Tax=Oncorhynchus kisutch TaxID=8019 RepID=A0A8C7KEZ8_ONCKI
MSGVVAQCHYSFGLRTGVANNLCYFDEQTVIFPSGNNCVGYNIDQKWQRFIPGLERSQGMYALAISSNRRYLAVLEHGKRATITVYDLQHEQSRKRKVLSGGDIPVHEFVSMAFSTDSKYFIGQSGAPDYILFYWMWEKQKIIAMVKTTVAANPVNQVSLNPYDNTQICVSGNGVFKLFRYAEGALKQSTFQKLETHNLLSHAWVSEDRVIAGTEAGRLMVFESGDLRWDMCVSTKTTIAKGNDEESLSQFPRVTVITAYSKGFAYSAGPGTVCLFERTDDKDNYRKTRKIRIPPDQCSHEPSQAEQQQIVSLVISPSEETVVTSTDWGQLYIITLSSAEMSKGEQAQFEFLSYSFHSLSITGLSICIRKPFIATCSLDQSVLIWNFETNTLELYKEFQEEAFSIALHPSGLFVLVGFSDKLRLMNLLIDDVRTFKEFNVRCCRECAFSHGGHLFSAVNGNVIHIYSSTTLENVLNLKGHNGKVHSIVWSGDESRLVSCGMEGAVYEWNTLTGKQKSESVLKSCSYTGVTVSPDAVGTDCTLKEIQDCQILREVPAEDVAYTTITMSRSGRTLFTGTSIGTIRDIKYPLSTQKDWIEYQAHSSPVTKYPLTVSEDCCLLIWKIIDKEGRGLKRDKNITYNQVMLELKMRVEELKMENEYQLRLKDMNYNEDIKEMSAKFVEQIESLKTRRQILKTERGKMESANQEAMFEVMEKHSKELQDLESVNSQKLMLEYEKYQELQLKSQQMQQDYEEQLQRMEESKAAALEDLTLHYEGKLHEKLLVLEQVGDITSKGLLGAVFRWDLGLYIESLQDRVWGQNDVNIKATIKGWQETITAAVTLKLFSLQKNMDDRSMEKEKMKTEQQKLLAHQKCLERDILALKKEIQERDDTIQDKEKCIYDLKKKNQELGKFKFVLDYKIKELKKQIEPREKDIKEMKEPMRYNILLLYQFFNWLTVIELDIAEQKLKLTTTDKEMHKGLQKVRDVEALVRWFKTDLHNCVGFTLEPKRLKDSITDLYDRYVQKSDVVDIVGVDAEVQRGYARHREHLERNVASLKRKLAKDGVVHHADNVKIMQVTETRLFIKDCHKITLLSPRANPSNMVVRLNQEGDRIVQLQRLEIHRLREEIQVLMKIHPYRPPSTAKLPSLQIKS